jgi:predicted transcriptional regulator YdeE
MEVENVTLEEFKVVGISVRTTNKDGQSKKDISELWGRFMGENMAEIIPHKVNMDIYCIYTDYESDYMGAYTTVLGYKVKDTRNVPQGMAALTIPSSSYRPYLSFGNLPQSVLNTWKHIWESGVKRKYLADFDVYPPDAFSSANPVVETYVSV